MHMYSAAIDALPFAEDKKFHKRADVVLEGMRKLRTALADAASSNRPSPAVIVELSNVRRRYDSLMEHAAAAPGSSLGQQLYVTRIHAKLSAEEVANGAGLRLELRHGSRPPTAAHHGLAVDQPLEQRRIQCHAGCARFDDEPDMDNDDAA